VVAGVSAGGDYSAPPNHFHHTTALFCGLLMDLNSIGPAFGRLGSVSSRVKGGAEVEAQTNSHSGIQARSHAEDDQSHALEA